MIDDDYPPDFDLRWLELPSREARLVRPDGGRRWELIANSHVRLRRFVDRPSLSLEWCALVVELRSSVPIPIDCARHHLIIIVST